ncbi:MAG: hypothetical protein NTZ09_05000 [Candidatus Hydrogenedentes bacterium]|nr:hypothetical protein [Candidatus Hydrogenedentota bacterium]
MKQGICTIALMFVLIGVVGCNTASRQPQFQRAAIVPDQLKPGDTAMIQVEVKDRHDIVRRVEGIVKEDPTIRLKLHDDGQPPDEKAGDNVWVLQVDVPFQATPGDFLLQLSAYRADGTVVPVKTKAGTVPLSTTVPLKILNP